MASPAQLLRSQLWKPGESGNPAGKPPGTPNHTTRAAKEALEYAFDALGGAEKLAEWAAEHPDLFYALWIKLLPRNLTLDGGARVVIRVEYVTPQALSNGSGAREPAPVIAGEEGGPAAPPRLQPGALLLAPPPKETP